MVNDKYVIMKREDILPAIEQMVDMYIERMRPLISQALVNSAIWGETNLPVSNSVRNEVLMKAEKSAEFRTAGDNSIIDIAEKEWPSVMFILQDITLANGKKWIENWDEKSAREGFLAGARLASELALVRLKDICKS